MRNALNGPGVLLAALICAAGAQARFEGASPQGGSISGQVRDTSAGAMPGVSVTASADATLRISSICECVGYVPSVPVRPRSGVVLDTSGRPLPHARLEIVAPDRREVAYADAAGRFEVLLPNHPPWPLNVSDSGFRLGKFQASRAHVTPMVVRLELGDLQNVPETETFNRGCRCPSDLFTHQGR